MTSDTAIAGKPAISPVAPSQAANSAGAAGAAASPATIARAAHAPAPAAAPSAPGAVNPRKLAVWLFLGSEILFFSALIFSYVALRLSAPPIPEPGAWPMPLEIQGSRALGVDPAQLDPAFVELTGVHIEQHGGELVVPRVLNIPLTALNTFLLIVSSMAVVLALHAIQHGNRGSLVRWLGLTLVLGITFLGIQAYEYGVLLHEGLSLSAIPDWLADNGRSALFGTTFYAMTGFHGLHVFAGVVMLSIVFFKAVRGLYTPDNFMGVELFGLYWHFVDLVWIILFTIVYLI